MSVLLHALRPDDMCALNADTFRPELSTLDHDALTAAVPPADLATRRARVTRIFQIGFNFCGTASLYRFFQRSGISATRFNRGFLASALRDNINEGRKPLAGRFDRHVAFTDIHHLTRHGVVEGIYYFRQLHAYYPNSYFILNTGNKDAWIEARMAHGEGAYARRYSRALKLPDDTNIAQRWAEDWDQHHSAAAAYFADKPGRLLIHDVASDDPQRLVDFIAPDFTSRAQDFQNDED